MSEASQRAVIQGYPGFEWGDGTKLCVILECTREVFLMALEKGIGCLGFPPGTIVVDFTLAARTGLYLIKMSNPSWPIAEEGKHE